MTGGCGWIGEHLTRALTARGHDTATYNQHCPAGGDPSRWVGDIRDRPNVEAAINGWEPDVVIHLAARYGRVWCESDRALTFSVNVAGTANVAQVCDEAAIPFVLASSSEVYGNLPGAPRAVRYAAELTGLEPLNTYGESKLMAEKVARRIVAPDLLAIWRLNMPYGTGGRPGNSGVPGYGYNALHTWMWQAVNGLDLITYRDTSRSWTHIDDVTAAMTHLLELGHRGAVNVCSSRDMRTSYDTARTVLDHAAGSPSRIVQRDAPPGVTPWKQLNDATLYALGWEPTISLDDGIEATIDYMRRFDREGRWVDETAATTHA